MTVDKLSIEDKQRILQAANLMIEANKLLIGDGLETPFVFEHTKTIVQNNRFNIDKLIDICNNVKTL